MLWKLFKGGNYLQKYGTWFGFLTEVSLLFLKINTKSNQSRNNKITSLHEHWKKIYKHPSAPSISTTEVTLTVQHADRARANFMWRKRLLWFRRRKLISQFSFRAPPWRSHTYILLQTVCKLYVLEVTYYVLSLKWSDNCSINIC